MDQATGKLYSNRGLGTSRSLTSRSSDVAAHLAPYLSTRASLDTRISDTTTPSLNLGQLPSKQDQTPSATQTPRRHAPDDSWGQTATGSPHHSPSTFASPYLAPTKKSVRAPSRQAAPDRWTPLRPARSDENADAVPAPGQQTIPASSQVSTAASGKRVDRLMTAYGITASTLSGPNTRLSSPYAAPVATGGTRSGSRGRVSSPPHETPWTAPQRAAPSLADTQRSYSLTQRSPSLTRGTALGNPWSVRDSFTSRPHSRVETPASGSAGSTLVARARGSTPPWQGPSYPPQHTQHGAAPGQHTTARVGAARTAQRWTNPAYTATRNASQPTNFPTNPATGLDSDSDSDRYSEPGVHMGDPLDGNDDGFPGVGRPIPVIVTRGQEVVETLDLVSEGSQASSVADELALGQYDAHSVASSDGGGHLQPHGASTAHATSGLSDKHGHNLPCPNSQYSEGGVRMGQQASQASVHAAAPASSTAGPGLLFGDLTGSMSYEDIPVVDQGLDHAQEESGYGMTLDEFMARMTTTPASQAATSGLGEPEDGEADATPSGRDTSHAVQMDSHTTSAMAAGQRRTSAARHQALGPMDGSSLCSSMTAGLELRPATAAAPARPDSALGRRYQLDSHHETAPTKQVDLGGLPRALFAPSPTQAGPHGAKSGRVSAGAPAPMTSGVAARVDAWSAQLSSRNNNTSATSAHADNSILSHAAAGHSGRGAVGSARTSQPGPVAAAPRPQSGSRRSPYDARGRQTPCFEEREAGLEADRASVAAAAAAALVRPTGPTPGGTRLVQSARPATRDGAPVDPSVWRDRIAAQLERPPSRQRPPPQALHLWTPLSSVAEQGEQQGLVPNETRGPAAHRRPQSAAPTAGNAVPAAGPHKPQGSILQGASGIDASILGGAARHPAARQAVRAAW